jgi:hypothetical protein
MDKKGLNYVEFQLGLFITLLENVASKDPIRYPYVSQAGRPQCSQNRFWNVARCVSLKCTISSFYCGADTKAGQRCNQLTNAVSIHHFHIPIEIMTAALCGPNYGRTH